MFDSRNEKQKNQNNIMRHGSFVAEYLDGVLTHLLEQH